MAETRDETPSLPVAEAGMVAVAVAQPTRVEGAETAAPDLVSRPVVDASIELSDPAAMPLDAVPASALDVVSLAPLDSPASAWDGEHIAFGSAEAEHAPAGATLDAETPDGTARTIDALGPTAAFHADESVDDIASPGGALGLDPVVAAEAHREAPPSIASANESDWDNVAVSGISDVESTALVATAEMPTLGDTPSNGTTRDAEGVEEVAGVDAVQSALDQQATSWLDEAPPSGPEWQGDLESVRLEGNAPSNDEMSVEPVALLHTPHADGDSASTPALELELPKAEAEAPLLDVELKGFLLKPEEVLEVPAPIPGFERMLAEPQQNESEWAEGDVAAEDGDSAVVSAAVTAVTADDAGDVDGADAEAVVSWRVASAPPETLAQGDAELQELVLRSRSQAHVLETLEAVARRVRGGEIVPTTDAGASPEAVLASVLASLLSARP